jgi:hypothetical protein
MSGWAELVAQAGYCHHPIRLAGRVEQADRTTGEVRTVYDSEREPDGVLLKACGTRRESRCPSCAATYRADAYQLLAAGLKGGKGVPETIAEHPRLAGAEGGGQGSQGSQAVGQTGQASLRPPRAGWLHGLGCSRETSDRSHLGG